ncbi:DNA translocase FtsK [Anaerobacillus alkaliphilus]|uniref:DNA translocase FtsK n=1 Tax=Anaerobacillus alkaliphilus TaxID=1548597 RepID=A0A4Q0VT36_9BACI|nr:DNA translocase FtsK [Anaerobacillus alkaliphilus]RXI98590.1 DNA translocase FtsK [Anaerobacillus alkaliphilus]
MYKRLKIAYKKIHSFLFGQEEEHIHTREERKKYYGRIRSEAETEAKMIHQYPKEGKFRFPMIADEPSVTKAKPTTNQVFQRNQEQVSNKQKKVTPLEKSKEQKRVKSEDNAEVSPVQEKVRKKFQGVNFKATNIPSPIYAFGKPPGSNRSVLTDDDVPNETLNIPIELDEKIVELNRDDFSKLLIPMPAMQINGVEFTTLTDETLEAGAVNELYRKDNFIVSDLDHARDNLVEQIDQEDNGLQETINELNHELELHVYEEEDIWDENSNEDEGYNDSLEGIERVVNSDNCLLTHEEYVTEEPSPTAIEDFEELMVQSINETHEEIAAAFTEVSEETTAQDREELEQLPLKLNINNNETTKDDKDVPRKTVVPFNVLMFHKDRLAQKRTEAIPEKTYQFPTLQLLNIPPRQPENSHKWLDEKKDTLEVTLANFNVQAKVVGVTRGPSVTRFEIQPEPGVKVSKVTGLQDDIKLSLAAKDIRMEAPIPGKNAIGIEVPNDVSDPVVIREILRSSEFQKSPSPLTVALGLDIEGKPIVTDIQKMPHGLIAGATGSGKSVCINSILVSIMFKATPEEVKLMLVDPKMVELAPYNDIPHLVTPVITDAKQATIALKWAVEEMERRYELFVQNGVRDIKRYNEVMKIDGDPTPAMPYIVIVIDELADLMMVSPHDVEEAICRIAQKARACGIHLLLATQRPSVDVITGLIKANIPTRIAFSVSSQADSRTIIDSGGAERLLGKGDMLLFENGSSKPVRVQGNYVSDEEIDRVVALVKAQRKPNFLFDKESLIKSYETVVDQEDDLFEEACYYVLEQGGASSSSLQRRYRIGFNRAARLIDMMEARGIISEAMGSKPRNVLISEEELSDRM